MYLQRRHYAGKCEYGGTVLANLLWIFLEKKSEKVKYLKNLMIPLKKFSGFVRETNEEENAKKI